MLLKEFYRVQSGFFEIPFELENVPNFSAKLKKNCGCQMVTHLSIVHGLDCITSVTVMMKKTKHENSYVTVSFYQKIGKFIYQN